MGANLSMLGHDMSGAEANLTTVINLLNADAGCVYFATDTGRCWVCAGSGVWTCLGVGGTVAPGGAGSYTPLLKLLTGLTDATATNLAVVTVPNAIMGGGLAISALATLGDGDSSEQSYWTVAISRIAGANAKQTISAKANNVNTTGATANAAGAITSAAVSGAVGVVNTFQLKGTVTKSAGSSTGHSLLCLIEVFNNLGSGITVA